MLGDYTAYYLSEEEFKKAIELNIAFKPLYDPYLIVKIVNHHNEQTFEGVICEGKVFKRSMCITFRNAYNKVINIDYNQKKIGVFTFDGVRFFRIIGTAQKSDEESLIFFTFKYIDVPTFTEKNTAFMVMPFANDGLNEFYRVNIKEYLWDNDLNILVRRADDFAGTDVIADTILEQIRKAEFIICDITACNKNVFFEIGFAKGINKDIIFLLEYNQPALFFDVNHIRRIEYNTQRPADFQKLLRETVISIRSSRR